MRDLVDDEFLKFGKQLARQHYSALVDRMNENLAFCQLKQTFDHVVAEMREDSAEWPLPLS